MTFLQARSPRERAIVFGLAAVVVVALLAAFAWRPLERRHARLAAEIPQLRASLASLERDAAEVKRLSALPQAASAANEPLVSIVTAGGGGSLPGAQLSVLDGRTLVVTAQDIAFGTLIEWLAATQSSRGLRVETARIEALPARGRVRAELRLSRS